MERKPVVQLGGGAMRTTLLCALLTTASLLFAGDVPERCVLSVVVPSYPSFAHAARVIGTVKVRILVDEKGDVTEATAISGHAMLKGAAVDNIKAWKFAPAHGAAASQLVVTYVFTMEGQVVPTTSLKCAHVKLDLPTRVEITVPPWPVETENIGN